MTTLKKYGIITQVHYIPVTSHPYYINLGYNSIDYKNASRYYEECITLPLYYTLSDEDQNFIIDKIKMILQK